MKNKPIGIFDSGVGGLSVMRTAMKILPNEKYIYLADFMNAPYGSKSKQEIQDIALQNMNYLISRDVKMAVVACNTATSAAINELREIYTDISVVGIEPAIKPASQAINLGKTIVLATPATLRLMKFQKLYDSLGDNNVIPIECENLSKMIEEERPGSAKIKRYLEERLKDLKSETISAVVIGCTHFSFIEDDIKSVTNNAVIFDGRYGTARHMKKILEQNDLLSDESRQIELISNEEDRKFQKLLFDFMSMPLSDREA